MTHKSNINWKSIKRARATTSCLVISSRKVIVLYRRNGIDG